MAENLSMGVLLTVFSTASAVGKTLLSINMAAALAKHHYRVCVVDLDLQFGDVVNFLQLSPVKTLYDAQLAVQKDVETFVVDEFTSPYKYNGVEFSVLAAPVKLEEAYNVSTANVLAVLAQLRARYDYIVLDTTSAFSELNLAVLDVSTIVTFVGIVDFIPTIKNMKVGYDTMRDIGYEKNKIRFILNRNKSKTNIELDDVEQLLEESFYHVLPNEFAAAKESIHNGIPLVLQSEQTPLGKGLEDLVDKYTNRLQGAGNGKSVLGSLFGRFFR